MPIIKAGGVDVNFPFTPYPCQVDYMEKLIECLKKNENGILESPTGTGKTLCLLCSSLAWLQTKKAQVQMKKDSGMAQFLGDKENITDEVLKKVAANIQQATGSSWGSSDFVVPKIIYASRTHSQLSQAIQELKRTSYNNMKVAVIGSREQLCINEGVKKETSNSAKVHMCRAKVTARKCHYYNVLEDVKKNSEPRAMVGDVVDIEDLIKHGHKSKVCPYYMARELKTDADIIFMPYNYLLDPKSRRANGVELQGNILIFDEAHNLEKICEDSASFDLSSVDLATAMEETTRLMERLVDLAQMEDQSLGDGEVPIEPEFNLEELLKLKSTLKELEESIDALTIPQNGLTKPGVYIFELLAGVGITYETKNALIDLLEKIVAFITSGESSSGLHTKGAGLSKFTDSLKKVFSQEIAGNVPILQHQAAITQSFKVHIHLKQKEANKKKIDSWATSAPDKGERIVSFWCFSSGQTMKELVAHGVRSIILTSGTLSPISSFTMEMQIPFQNTLENPHVIEQHQVCVCTLKVGPDNFRLNSSYDHRFDPRYLTSLGNTIVNFSRIVPNGLLVFFPSYIVMDKSIEFWQQNNIWDRIIPYKPIFVEPTGKRGFVETMEEFYEKVNDPTKNGAIFMAVCRGKVSEGLDFADTNGRAVLITGIPYPPMKDPKIILKKQYLDEMVKKGNKNVLAGQKWYTQQATRAVNQAVGRVIRHKQDYGAIILCDERFARQDSIQQLPVWVRPYVNNFDSYGKAQGFLLKFFKTAESKMPAPQLKKKLTSSSTYSSSSVGCEGAYFQPTAVRKSSHGSSRGKIELASNVACHGQSLQASKDDISKFSSQYSSIGKSSKKGSTSKQGLIQALEFDEKTNEESDNSFTINEVSKFGPQKATFRKKKIVVKRLDEISDTRAGKASDGATITQKHYNHAESYLEEIKQALCKDGYRRFSKALHEYKQQGDYIRVTAVLADLFTSTSTHYHLFRKFYRFVRAKHKQEFDQLCKEITGEGAGYKPEDSISTKRLRLDSADGPQDKKAKISNANRLPSITENVIKVSSDIASSSSHLNTLSNCPFSGKQSAMNNVTTSGSNTSSDVNTKQTVNNTSESCSSSSIGVSSNTNSQSSSLSTCSLDNTEKLSPQVAQDLDRILSTSNKACSGYTCSLCGQDAKVPYEAPCEHTCCIACWRLVLNGDKLCPGCGIRIRRRHLIQRLFASGPNLSN